jgi:hypothetical protein
MRDQESGNDGRNLLVRLHEVLDALERSNSPVDYQVVTHGTYVTARGYIDIFAGLGWISVIIGVLLIAAGLSSTGGHGFGFSSVVFAMPLGIVLAVGGVVTVVQCQTARAAIDSADYARQSLEILALRSVRGKKSNVHRLEPRL